MSVRISEILSLGNGDDLLKKKRLLSAERQRRLRKLIRAKTLLGLKPRMSDEVRSALQAFTIAVRRLGKGTGANAPRWRRAMRDEAMKASRAAPVWIMPEYKVSEQLPSVASSFDLVVLDEASQCDVTSLASLARGARCLIVGDEKQVSPSSVGLPSQRINVLRAQFLSEVPARNMIDQDTSIFDLATQMYPANHLMLKEHFRCVEPIIRYSSRFYQDRLVPLRVPKASERFDPPLVELHVSGASRDGQTNPAEATVIVDEIAAIVQNPKHAWRGIAVISLIGRKQADLIERRLISDERIGTEAMKRHSIICGDARTLQGQERSVVFLSMVAVPETVRAQSSKDVQQRMNVAMSRACDRLYLARSVSMSDLKPGDIKADVLKHFRDPMPEGGSAHDKSVIELCDSGFERDVCQRLMDANYRTRAQVRAGPFRIDLVVEGADDRRLAIELDGDYWHGPDVWRRDMRRQASLERAGWTFWRVFGSQWISNKEHHWNDLLATLERLGIEPIGAKASNDVFNEVRRFVVDGNGVRMRDVAEDADDELDVVNYVNADSSDTTEIPDIVFGDVISTGVASEEIVGDDSGDRVQVNGTADEVLESDTRIEVIARDDLDETTDDGEQVVEGSDNVDGDLAFYEESHRPILLERLITLVEDEGPMDLELLTRLIAGHYGFKRTGRVIRDTVRNTLSGQRAISMCPGTRHETVWPIGQAPTELISWEPDLFTNTTDWDLLSAPVRAGLVAYVLESSPEDIPRAVLNLIDQRKLTKRLTQEIEASRVVAERHVDPLSALASEDLFNSVGVAGKASSSSIPESQHNVSAFNAARLSERRMDELIGQCRVVLADGVVAFDELKFLQDWLHNNRDVSLQWPADVLDARLRTALAGDALSPADEHDMLETLLQITGDPSELGNGNSGPTSLPFDEPAPAVEFQGRRFCFTGKFVTGTRAEVQDMTERLRGRCRSTINQDLDYLVIGSIGSSDWIHSTHGRKIEKAVASRIDQGKPAIISERHWHESIEMLNQRNHGLRGS